MINAFIKTFSPKILYAGQNEEGGQIKKNKKIDKHVKHSLTRLVTDVRNSSLNLLASIIN